MGPDLKVSLQLSPLLLLILSLEVMALTGGIETSRICLRLGLCHEAPNLESDACGVWPSSASLFVHEFEAVESIGFGVAAAGPPDKLHNLPKYPFD